ncbi:unnamed protein product [Heligmosomoides polygyrus]|uniref:EcoEI_R_C domain-containing protein n=1 Tax=Heligmosomoides polygyrus TaxID=6339 RepID=A0A183GNF8_HELPZ|nr:unnamed protein product [Heligmosomoides polygyrus]
MRIFITVEKDETNPNPLMEPIYQGDIVDTVIRMDPRDIQAIIQAMEKKTTSVADQQALSSQWSVIAEIVQSLTVRNETVNIADYHPQAFQFLDMKSKSESLKAMDLKLSEFVKSVKKN